MGTMKALTGMGTMKALTGTMKALTDLLQTCSAAGGTTHMRACRPLQEVCLVVFSWRFDATTCARCSVCSQCGAERCKEQSGAHTMSSFARGHEGRRPFIRTATLLRLLPTNARRQRMASRVAGPNTAQQQHSRKTGSNHATKLFQP